MMNRSCCCSVSRLPIAIVSASDCRQKTSGRIVAQPKENFNGLLVSHRGMPSIGSMLRYALHNPQSTRVANRDNPPIRPPMNTARALITIPAPT